MQAAVSQSHINLTGSFTTDFYILNMPVDIDIWRAVIGLFVSTTQQSAVFHLTKCRDCTLYNKLLFILLLKIFKEFSNVRDLILRTFLSLVERCLSWKKTCHENGHDFCVSLYTFTFISLEIYFALKLLLILCGDIEVNPGPGHYQSFLLSLEPK